MHAHRRRALIVSNSQPSASPGATAPNGPLEVGGLLAERVPVEGRCPSCGQGPLAQYVVHSEGGWFEVVKCQSCLHSVSRVKGHRLGFIQLLSDSI